MKRSALVLAILAVVGICASLTERAEAGNRIGLNFQKAFAGTDGNGNLRWLGVLLDANGNSIPGTSVEALVPEDGGFVQEGQVRRVTAFRLNVNNLDGGFSVDMWGIVAPNNHIVLNGQVVAATDPVAIGSNAQIRAVSLGGGVVRGTVYVTLP